MARRQKTLSYVNTSPRTPRATGEEGTAGTGNVSINLTTGNGSGAINVEALKELLKRELSDAFLSSQLDDTAEGVITFEKGLAIKGALINRILTSFSEEAADDQSLFTAARVLLELQKLDGRFLSKIKPDETPYHIKLLGGLTTTEVASDDYAEGTEKAGWAARKDIDNNWMLEADHVMARILAEVQDLLVKNQATFQKALSSDNFISGFAAGKGWRIHNQEYVNAAGVTEKRSVAEFDELVVRGSMRIYEMIVSQLLGENDNRVFTGMAEVDHYDATEGKIYIKTNDGRTYNPFRKDDILLVQQYNGMPSEDNAYYITKQYELKVTQVGVGSLEKGEERLDWIMFSNFATPIEDADAATLITAGDTLTRWDNTSDPTRKGVVTIMSVGQDTPYIDFIYGAKTDPENSVKSRLGNLGGIYNPLFGQLNGFGAYLTNIYAVGELVMRHNGVNVADALAMMEGEFKTNFRQAQYDITEEDNFFTNASWINGAENWLLGDDTTGYFLVGDFPQFFNHELYAASDSFAGVDTYDGRSMLRLCKSNASQDNSLIRKPGTHKVHTGTTENADGTYTKVFEEVPDTLYLSVRIYVTTSGTIEMGFASDGTFIDNAFHITRAVEAQVDAYEIKVASAWDGVGDFTIQTDGDMYIDLLSLTDRPLDNFRTETMTSIEQTAAAINLIGKRVSGAEGSITELGISLNAAKEEIKLYVDKEVGDVSASVSQLSVRVDGIALVVAEVEGSASLAQQLANAAQGAADAAVASAIKAQSLANAAQGAADDAAGAAAGAQSTANSAQSTANSAQGLAESHASIISTHDESISLLTGAFTLKNGKYVLTKAAGVVITDEVASLYATKTTVNAMGARVTTAEANISVNAEEIALKVSKNGVVSAINQSAETVKIQASKIDLQGQVTFSMLASGVQTTINNKVEQAHINESVNALKGTLKKLAYEDAVEVALLGSTIISGGVIRTELLNVTKIFAVEGTVGGFTIGTKSLVNTEADVTLSIGDLTGNKFVSLNDSNGVLYARNDEGTAVRIYTDGSTGVGLSVQAQQNGKAISSLGNVNLTARPSGNELITISGLAVGYKTGTTFTGPTNASIGNSSAWVDFLIANGNVTLPTAASCPGKVIYIKFTGSYKVSCTSPIYKGNSYSLYPYSNGVYSDTFSARSLFFISAGSAWYEFLTFYRS